MYRSLSPGHRYVSLLALTGVYFAAGKLGLSLAIVNPSASVVWPCTGIALAALLILGRSVWPAIFIGAYCVNLTTAGTWATSLVIAGGNTLEALVGAWLVTKYANGLHAFDHSYGLFKFVGLAAFVSTLVSATIGTTALVLGHLTTWSYYGPIWLTWWQGDALGNILFAPLLILWRVNPKLSWTREQKFEAPFLFFALSLLALVGFCNWYPSASLASYVRIFCIPMVIWAAFRFGPREAASISAIFCALVMWGTLQGWGPFGNGMFSNDMLLRLQLYMAVVTVMGISIGVEVAERKQIAKALTRVNEELELRVSERTASLTEAIEALRNQISARSQAEERFWRVLDSNIIGFMIVDMQGKVLEANNAFLNALGYSREDLATGLVGGPGMTPREYQTMDEWVRARLNDAGYCPAFEKEYIRKDGSRWPVLVGSVRLDSPEPHCVCFVIDVTERRKAQDALRLAYDDMEKRVDERTNDLVKANTELEKEIGLRKRAEEELRNQSLHDSLTGLYNRRGFLALADQQLLQALRDKREFLLFFADVDGLKQINDTLGHMRGDQALIKSADALRETFRKSDILARIGGDEFAIVATEADPSDRKAYFARLGESLNRLNLEGNFPFLISLSIGMAVFDPRKITSLQELMAQADQDLYKYKRNRHQRGIKVIRAA